MSPLISWSDAAVQAQTCIGARRSKSGYKLTTVRSQDWRETPRAGDLFCSWSLLSPPDAACARDQRSPDVYVNLSNRRGVSMVDIRFGPVVTLAIAADIPGGAERMDAAVHAVAELTSALMIARTLRSWGVQTENGYTDGIAETDWFRAGLAGRDADDSILEGNWNEVVLVPGKGRA